MALPMDTCGDTLPPGTHGPDGRDNAFPSTCGSGSRGTSHRAVGATGRPLRKTFFLQCQRRHPELPKIPTYLPHPGENMLQFAHIFRDSRSGRKFREHRKLLNLCAHTEIRLIDGECFFQSLENLSPG